MSVSEMVLVGLLVGSNVFWAINSHKLLNKLMSRNYFEFNQAQLKSEKNADKIVLPPDETEDFGSLSELIR